MSQIKKDTVMNCVCQEENVNVKTSTDFYSHPFWVQNVEKRSGVSESFMTYTKLYYR